MPSLDHTVTQTCTLHGISIIGGKLTNLRKLEISIQKNLLDLSRVKSHQELMTSALLGLQLTKATCDAFISLAADAADLIGSGGSAKLVSSGYSAASALATSTTQSMIGQQANWGATAGTIINSAAPSLLKAKLDTKNVSAAASLIKQGTIKTDLLVSAFKNDEAGIKKAAVAYGKSVAQMVATAANSRLGKVVSVMSTLDTYNTALARAFDEAMANRDSNMFVGAKRSLEAQLKKIHALIGKFQDQLDRCFIQLA
jgi:hypothetical protein